MELKGNIPIKIFVIFKNIIYEHQFIYVALDSNAKNYFMYEYEYFGGIHMPALFFFFHLKERFVPRLTSSANHKPRGAL